MRSRSPRRLSIDQFGHLPTGSGTVAKDAFQAIVRQFGILLLLLSANAFADFNFTSATLNGGTVVQVAPGTSINAALTLNYFGNTNGANGQWGSTLWTVNGVSTCEDHADKSNPGPDSITFTITAPAANGLHDVRFQAFSNDNCGGQNSAIYTLSGAIRVQAATLLGEWRLEETAWAGLFGEVTDSSGNNRHGTATGIPFPTVGTTLPARDGSPGTCNYGSFGGNTYGGPALTLPGLPGVPGLPGLPVDTSAGAKTSVTFWMYWDGTNNVMPIGWHTHDLWLVNGHFGFNTGNSDVYGISSAGVANGWHHVTAIFTNGAVAANELYIDGVKQTLSQRQSSPNNANAYVRSMLQVSGWQRDTGYRFSGRIDEISVYNGALTQAEINAIFAATHTCPPRLPPPPPLLVAEYRFDDDWPVTASLLDSSGYNRHAALTGGSVDQINAPASGLKPASCKAGNFTRSGYFTSEGLKLDTTSGAKSSVAFWMYWDGRYPSDGWAMPFRWDGQFYDLAFKSNGWFGFNTGQGDVYGFSSSGLANGWHHVVAVFNNGGVGSNKIYLDGQQRVLQSDGSHAARSISTVAVIGAGGNWSNGYKFGGSLDNLRIYQGELGQTEVTELYQLAQPCDSVLAEWRMDETTWNGSAGEVKDSGVSAKHGRALNGANTALGKICQGGIFDGATNRYAALPADIQNLPGLSPDNFTMAVWVKPGKTHQIDPQSSNSTTGVSGQNYALYPTLNTSAWNWDTGGYAGAGVSVGTNGISVYEHAGGYMPPVLVWEGAVSNSEWSHIAIVYNGGVPSLYVNGSFRKTGVAGTHPNHANVVPTYIIGSATYGNYQGGVDEYKIFSGALTATQILTGYANEAAGKNWDGSTRTCAAPPNTGPAALNAVDVGANAVTGQITTKIAGAAFNLDLYALNVARTAQDNNASGEVLVDLLANTATGVALDANNCPVTATSLTVGSVTLTAGKATATLGAITNAWRDVRVRMRFPATGAASVTACSTDNFAVKPAALAVIASHADWQTPGTGATLANTGAAGGEVHKAGRPFSVRVTAYNVGNSITGNYDGNPTASSNCILPASGCQAGLFSAGAFSATAGTVASNTASYSEVGAISVNFTDSSYASVDSDDTAATCAGYHVCSSAINIGRFVPDNFAVSSNSAAFAPACGSFTYLGQPFGFGTAPLWTVTARNSGGAPTRNYTGNLFKIAASSVTSQTWSATNGTVAAVGTLPAVSVTDLGGGLGSLAFSVGAPAGNAGLAFTRTTPLAPFDASLTLSASVADSEGVTYAGNPFQHSGIGFDDGDVVTTSDAQMRFGRLRLSNATGSELLSLPLPLTAQYWNGQGFIGNGADNCTALAAPTLTFFSQSADNQLASGETTASFNATLVAGNGNLRFSAPGTGNFGYLDLSFIAPAWLKFNWDGIDQAGDGNLLDDDPRARATFGKRRGSNKVIIRREVF